MEDKEFIVLCLEKAAAWGAAAAISRLRELGYMPAKIRLQIWTEDPDHRQQYKNTEYESIIDQQAFEASYQAYLRDHPDVPDLLNDLSIKDILRDVNEFIKTEQKPKDEGGSGEPPLLADDGPDGHNEPKK